MVTKSPNSEIRWWRRSRDEALKAVVDAQVDAAEAMYDLDRLQKDLPELVKIHQHSIVNMSRSTPSDDVTKSWDQLVEQVDKRIQMFLDADSSFKRDFDYQEFESRKLIQSFEYVTKEMRSMIPYVERFREIYEGVLNKAFHSKQAATEQFLDAETKVKNLKKIFDAENSKDFFDKNGENKFKEVLELVKTAKESLSQQKWTETTTSSIAAIKLVKEVEILLNSVQERGLKIKNSYSSVTTRVDGLANRTSELPELMSSLRRGYSRDSWEHVENAPKLALQAVEETKGCLISLKNCLANKPVDVSEAYILLGQVRNKAGQVDSIIDEVKDTVTSLNKLRDNPDSATIELDRVLVDTRRFLNQLPPNVKSRFAYTFDHLAQRAEDLKKTLRQSNPNWGKVLKEISSIRQGIDNMVETIKDR